VSLQRRQTINMKIMRPGEAIPTDLRLYLNIKFTIYYFYYSIKYGIKQLEIKYPVVIKISIIVVSFRSFQ